MAYNPISNLSLGCGFADIIKMKNNNINVCIGTDGVGSGYTLNLFKHLNFAYLLSKGLLKI
jgi:5-methylthioadenosine/S-adenosylhomocysteine deaminase